MSNLVTTIKDIFPKKKIAILGDLVADQFLRGTISRVSREAPVFILRHDETETLAGGAANAAVNIASLGGKPLLVGLIGRDANGGLLSTKLASAGVDCTAVVAAESITTTTKIRVLAGQHYAPRQQVIRIDYENQAPIAESVTTELEANLERVTASADAMVISDYGYGVAAPGLIERVHGLSQKRGIPLLIDSRFRLGNFAGSTAATPNQDEVEAILGKNFTDSDCEKLREELRFESLLVTRGNKGMLLLEGGKDPLQIPAIGGMEPVDVTGAGDTVIAVYALAIASGLSFVDAANIANHAGGLVVMKKGTASISTDELVRSIKGTDNKKASEALI
jgi:rfaE bifunctional protein kinase chain/domain